MRRPVSFTLPVGGVLLASLAGWLTWSAASSPGTVLAAETEKASKAKAAEDDTQPAARLRLALAAETKGDAEGRSTLLRQVVDEWPDFAPARWQSGHVRRGGRWRPVAEAERLAMDDPLEREYEQLVLNTPNTADGHQALATWCRKHKLDAEARGQWLCVLNLDPQNVTAQRSLGLQWYNGSLATAAEVAEQKKQAGAVLKAQTRWHADLTRWQNDLLRGDESQRAAAVRGIESIDDPDAIPLLESLLTHKSPSYHDATFGLAVIGGLNRMRDPRAAEVLVRQAVLSGTEETRQAATAALAKRDPTEYVPYALGNLQSPWRRQFNIGSPDGVKIVYQQELFRESAEIDDYRYSEQTFVVPLSVMGTIGNLGRGLDGQVENARLRAMAQANTAARLDAVRIERENAATMLQNEGICRLMQANFGANLGRDIDGWWDWWNKYNEMQSTGPKPVRFQVQSGWRLARSWACSCFAAGTPVSTKTGLQPIEKIQPGMLVLAQDPQTGELVYKSVVARTFRPPSALRQLSIGRDMILTTRGHRFWQEGRGWQMAKQLEAGVPLRGLDGPLRLEAVAEALNAAAYNLVVDDFHTYFVGRQRVLVHDNSAPKPVLGGTPGLVEAEAAAIP